jgi:hypothetical protein
MDWRVIHMWDSVLIGLNPLCSNGLWYLHPMCCWVHHGHSHGHGCCSLYYHTLSQCPRVIADIARLQIRSFAYPCASTPLCPLSLHVFISSTLCKCECLLSVSLSVFPILCECMCSSRVPPSIHSHPHTRPRPLPVSCQKKCSLGLVPVSSHRRLHFRRIGGQGRWVDGWQLRWDETDYPFGFTVPDKTIACWSLILLYLYFFVFPRYDS